MLRKVRLLAVLLTLVLLVSGVAQAMPLQKGLARPSESGGVLVRVWDWIATLFRFERSAPKGDLKSVWEGEGSHADPNGGH
ncbi:MAG TPA: hypothetical protein VN493_31765 [Thermoanaerobaculia bacterium]|nr:hypothetical protein [Thermoanaerobaculia bacterium]